MTFEHHPKLLEPRTRKYFHKNFDNKKFGFDWLIEAIQLTQAEKPAKSASKYSIRVNDASRHSSVE